MSRPQLDRPVSASLRPRAPVGRRAPLRTAPRRFDRLMPATVLAGGLLLGAAPPADHDVAAKGALSQGLRYDIHMTVVNTPPPDSGGTTQPPTTNTALAHAQVANGRAHVDIASGYFAGPWLSPGDYLLVSDSARTIVLVNPQNKLYAKLDAAMMMQGATAFAGMMGVQATNVKIDVMPLATEKVQQYTAQKYRVTEDYTVNIAVMGMSSTTVIHTTTDLWYVPSVTGIIYAFNVPITKETPTTGFYGADYATQMNAAKAKLPGGLPIKTVMASTTTDTKGNHSSTNSTWEITSVAQATISDAIFEVPADYTQFTGPIALMPAPGATAVAASPGSNGNGKSGSGVAGAAGNAATGVAAGAATSAAQGAQGTINQAASEAAASAVKKVFHLP